MKSFKSITALLFLFLFLSCSAVASAATIEVGTPAPAFALKTVNESVVKQKNVVLGNYFKEGTNTKFLVMSFFATYCVPCRNEIPFLQALYTAYHDQGLEVLLVSTDKDQDKINELAKITEDEKLTFPVLWDRLSIVSKRYGIERLPNVYMLGSDGRVFKVNTGYDEEKGPQELHDTIRQQLGIPLDAPIPEGLVKFLQPKKKEPVVQKTAPKKNAASPKSAPTKGAQKAPVKKK